MEVNVNMPNHTMSQAVESLGENKDTFIALKDAAGTITGFFREQLTKLGASFNFEPMLFILIVSSALGLLWDSSTKNPTLFGKIWRIALIFILLWFI